MLQESKGGGLFIASPCRARSHSLQKGLAKPPPPSDFLSPSPPTSKSAGGDRSLSVCLAQQQQCLLGPCQKGRCSGPPRPLSQTLEAGALQGFSRPCSLRAPPSYFKSSLKDPECEVCCKSLDSESALLRVCGFFVFFFT